VDTNEEVVFEAVLRGELEVDQVGRVWRVGCRRGSGRRGVVRVIPCERRRAENDDGRYLQVRVMVDGKRVGTQAARLVWRALHGPIPVGLTVNHKNGRKHENDPSNLELATMVEQIEHSKTVLGNEHVRKVPLVAHAEIARRYAAGEKPRSIARDFGVSSNTAYRIARASSCM